MNDFLKLEDLWKFLSIKNRVIVAGDRQTGKTTLAAKLVGLVLDNATLKVLYLGVSKHVIDCFKHMLSPQHAQKIDAVNYWRSNNIDRSVIGKRYDLIIVDASQELSPSELNIIESSAMGKNSKIVYFVDINTVRCSSIGRCYPTIVIGSKNENIY